MQSSDKRASKHYRWRDNSQTRTKENCQNPDIRTEIRTDRPFCRDAEMSLKIYLHFSYPPTPPIPTRVFPSAQSTFPDANERPLLDPLLTQPNKCVFCRSLSSSFFSLSAYGLEKLRIQAELTYWGTHSFACTVHSFACSALLALLACSSALIYLLAHLITHSRARGKVGD